jgi:ACS family hexuronate transporter-like MFS transporter
VFAFHAAYAVGLLGLGTLMDRIRTRMGFSLAIGFGASRRVDGASGRAVSGRAQRGAGLGDMA